MVVEAVKKGIPQQTLFRLPGYLEQLRALARAGVQDTSATEIARALGLGEVQVRKDLAIMSSSGGRPRTGYVVNVLQADIETFLGIDNRKDAAIVGVGHLGQALLNYEGISAYGMQIVVGFDNDPQLIGTRVNDKPILCCEKITDLVRRMHIHIGVIAVPSHAAQQACDMLTDGGVLAIWNFAPTALRVPEGVFLHNENMAASLAMLARRLEENRRGVAT